MTQCRVLQSRPNISRGAPASSSLDAYEQTLPAPPQVHFIHAAMTTPSSASEFIDDPLQQFETDSLPSSASSNTSSSPSDDFESDAEREWRESLQQLELLLTMVLVPYLGKYFGRRCAYWGESMELNVGTPTNACKSLGEVYGMAIPSQH